MEKPDAVDSTGQLYNLLDLPLELLVYIISFLITIRDKVKLRYVSHKLRIVSEAPSLWRQFVWPQYDCRENTSMMNVLKACGSYVKCLAFPGAFCYIPSSTLFETLSHCNNVRQLCLPSETEVDSEVLRVALQHMEYLEQLEVQLSTDMKPLLQIGGLKELTVRVTEDFHSMCTQWVQDWMNNKCKPLSLNLVTEALAIEEETHLIESFLDFNFEPLMYTSHFKYYYYGHLPLGLFSSFLAFQLEIGQTVTLPFVKASDLGILGLDWDILMVNSSFHDDKLVHKVDAGSPSVCEIFQNKNIKLNSVTYCLDYVTEFNFSSSQYVCPGHLEQLAIACPNLQRLNLIGNQECLNNLQGLQTIANNCPGLCGLNLAYISIQDQLGLWEILCKMKLTHLVVEACSLALRNNLCDPVLISYLQKLSSLLALQFECDTNCGVCNRFNVSWELFSHFASIHYLRLCVDHDAFVLQDIVRSCQGIKIFSCNSSECLMLSAVVSNSIQQLLIESVETNIPDIFMDSVSANGSLKQIVLSVNSLTIEGMTCLICNSPKLMMFKIYCMQLIYENRCDGIKVNDDVRKCLQDRFSDRKLFDAGDVFIGIGSCHSIEYVPKTDLYPLWPMGPI